MVLIVPNIKVLIIPNVRIVIYEWSSSNRRYILALGMDIDTFMCWYIDVLCQIPIS